MAKQSAAWKIKNEALIEAKQHIEQRQDKFKPIIESRKTEDNTPALESAILELYDNFPSLTMLQISELLAADYKYVREVIVNEEEEDEFLPRINKKAGVAHLALLRSEHPDRMYEEDMAVLGTGPYHPMRARQIEAYLP